MGCMGSEEGGSEEVIVVGRREEVERRWGDLEPWVEGGAEEEEGGR